MGLPGTRCIVWVYFAPSNSQRRKKRNFYQNHGGVAVVASSAIRLSKISAPFDPITFEHLIAGVTVSGSSHIFTVVYRPGSAKVTAAFFDELRLLLEFLCHRSPCRTSSLVISTSVSIVLRTSAVILPVNYNLG